MRRRTLLASTLGVLAAGAANRIVTPALAQSTAAPDAAGAPQGRWVTLAPFPEPTPELMGSTANGKAYAIEGQLPGFRPAGLVYEYDPAANTWTKKKAMPRPAHHAALVANGRIYVVGGAGPLPDSRDPALRSLGPHRSLATVEEYDPIANRWRPRRPMPIARNHLKVESAGGKVYAIGGRLGGAFIIGMPGNVDLTLEYDPVTDVWLTKAAMPTARSGANSASLGGRIYVAGGELQTYQFLAAYRAFEAYDPARNVWYQLPPLMIPRHEGAMAALGSRVHILGGDVQSAIVPLPAGLNFTTAGHEAFEVTG